MPPSVTTPLDFDCVVLGGGITGAGVARDAAMRGYRVLLVEVNDFISGTSHLTSKVVHGGLRYLENGQIRPVVEGLVERYRLLTRMAPNLVWPLKFVMPFEGHHLVKWLYTLCGLQLYGLPEWYRCGRSSTPMLGVRLGRDYPLMRPFPLAVTFWDAQTTDTRLVMATLRSAEAAGAVIRNYTAIDAADFDGHRWRLTLRSQRNDDGAQPPDRPGSTWTATARIVVNATGPWSPATAALLGQPRVDLLWLKGTHILMPRPPRFGKDAIVIRSIRDNRPLWAIPWQTRLIVGTTESVYDGDLRNIRPAKDEVDDLFDSVAAAFPGARFQRTDIAAAYAGVRPIVPQQAASANRLSREHRIETDRDRHVITVMGGKLTTFRHMAERTMDRADELLSRPAPDADTRRQIRRAMLWPGLTLDEARRLRANLSRVFEPESASTMTAPSQTSPADRHHRSTRERVTRHLVRHYGWEASVILERIARDPRLGETLYPGLPYCLAELIYLARAEKVVHLVDLIKRRTPIYFLADRAGDAALSRIAEHVAPIGRWTPQRVDEEIESVRREYQADMNACRLVETSAPSGAQETICA